MTVQELIDKLTSETHSNEKKYQIDIKDENGNMYKVTGYDWCDTTLLIEKV